MDHLYESARERAESFRYVIMELLDKSSLALLISIGHRTRLFDTMNRMTPASAHEIARTAGLDVRLVREWLGAMAVGGIVEYDPEGRLYFLPSAHAAVLTRMAQGDNLAVLTRFIAVAGAAEDDLAACFATGGGGGEAHSRRLHEIMAEERGPAIVATLFEQILPLAPGLLGELARGIVVLDVGCGIGRALNLMAGAFPHSRFTGCDLSENNIEQARHEAQQLGLGNVNYHVRDLSAEAPVTPPPERVDLITAFDALRRATRPDRVLAWIHQSLRPNGVLLIKEREEARHLEEGAEELNSAHPLGMFNYHRACLARMMVAPGGAGGAGQGAVWDGRKAAELLRQAGFEHMETFYLPSEPENQYCLAWPEWALAKEAA